MAASSSLNDSPNAYAGLRRVVLVVAALNFGYFWVETAVALAIGSVALLADGVDFLEDTAVNLLIALALAWPLRRRADLRAPASLSPPSLESRRAPRAVGPPGAARAPAAR